MAIVHVCERWPNRSANWNEKTRTYTRTFLVRTDSMLDDAQAVMQAKGLPRLGDYYESPDLESFDLAVRCVSVSPAQLESPFHWEVTFEYTTEAEDRNDPGAAVEGQQGSESGESPENQTPEQPESPTARPLRVRTSFERTTALATTDANGEPVVNSANEAFDPPPEYEVSLPVVSITRIEDSPSFALLTAYVDAVNSDDIQIGDLTIPPRQAKMRGISINDTEIDGQRCYEVTYEVILNAAGWNPAKVLDQGMTQIVLGSRLHVEVDGVAAPVPQLLDGEGAQLLPGGDPVFLEFDLYIEVPFAPLGIFQ